MLFAVLASAFSTWAALALTHASSIHCLVLSLHTLFDQVRYTSTTLSKIQPASHNGLVLHWQITHYTDNSSTKMSSPSAFQRAAVPSGQWHQLGALPCSWPRGESAARALCSPCSIPSGLFPSLHADVQCRAPTCKEGLRQDPRCHDRHPPGLHPSRTGRGGISTQWHGGGSQQCAAVQSGAAAQLPRMDACPS